MPDELKYLMKGLINVKNNDNKCLLWCHNRRLNLVERNPQRITSKSRGLVNKLDYEGFSCFKERLLWNRNAKQN